MSTIDLSHSARMDILDAALKLAAFDGWHEPMLVQATHDAGLPEGAHELYFAGGVMELIEFWHEQLDQHVSTHLAACDLDNMKIRQKVETGILAGLEVLNSHQDAARRVMTRLALPDGLALASKFLWNRADIIWRAIGDTSTDVNFYTKRMTLSAVISTSTMAWLSDTSEDKAKGRAFVSARINNVMQFEKAKAQFRKRTDSLPDPIAFMSRLRYGRRPRRRTR